MPLTVCLFPAAVTQVSRRGVDSRGVDFRLLICFLPYITGSLVTQFAFWAAQQVREQEEDKKRGRERRGMDRTAGATAARTRLSPDLHNNLLSRSLSPSSHTLSSCKHSLTPHPRSLIHPAMHPAAGATVSVLMGLADNRVEGEEGND